RRLHGLHRAAGRLAAAAVVIGGLTALPVAVMSEATAPARAGFFMQGVIWLGLLAAALAAIRRGDVVRHARLMIAMAAGASGAVWLRLMVAFAVAAALPFDPVYATAAWLSWLMPLAGVAAVSLVPRARPLLVPHPA